MNIKGFGKSGSPLFNLMAMTKSAKGKAVIPKNAATSWWLNPKKTAAILALIAFFVYCNTLANDFVLDDSIVITKNQFTTKGISGIADIFSHDTFTGYFADNAEQLKIVGGRYRPLSVAFFAVLFQLFGANSIVFHCWNILLYALCCGFLYLMLRKVFEPKLGNENAAILAGISALIYAVHPIHTEVVNNIKSNDEILCMILSLASLHYAIKYFETSKINTAIMAGASLFLALLAKENAVAFLAIIPASLYVWQQGQHKKSGAYLPLMASLGGFFLAYFLLRYAILGWSFGEAPLDLINNPFIKWDGAQWLHCSTGERLAMTFLSLGKYLQLLVLPYSLSSDYYPRYIDMISFGNPIALVSLLAYLALGGFVVYSLIKGRFGTVAYGVFFFLASLFIVSNLLFPIGTNLAERFAFMPSVGFCLAIAGLLLPFFTKKETRSSAIIGVGMVALLFAGRSFVRNSDYKSNLTLFSKDVEVAANSAKMQNGLGALLAGEAQKSQDAARRAELSNQAMEHLSKAIEIHPTYLEAFYMRGNVNFMLGKVESAVEDYRKCLSINPNFKQAHGNYALAMRETAKQLMEAKSDIPKAIIYLEESLKLFPEEQETAKLLEAVKAMQAVPAAPPSGN